MQSSKQETPKLVTELGISIEVKPVQPSKHPSAKLVTELGISIEVKPVQPEKHQFPKLVTTYIVPSTDINLGIHLSPVYLLLEGYVT